MRIVAHVDMDAFYAAVEERYNPVLRNRPIVVGADPKEGRGRGVVTAANYAARKYGIRSAMPISRAWRLAEVVRQRGELATVFLPDNHPLYREVSARIMTIIAHHADAFEEASVDEAYLDLSSVGSLAAAVERTRALKAEVLAREGLTCSVGIGPNKLIAKIASDLQKPDGLTVVRPDGVQDFLDPLPVRVIPGVGPKTGRFLLEQGIRIVGDLRGAERSQLVAWFGRWGEDLYAKARGISESPVSNEWEPKSMGEQETFAEDSFDAAFVLGRARALVQEVFQRLGREGFRGFRTVTVTVRLTHFQTFTRSHTVPEPLATEEALYMEATRLLQPFLDHRENPRLRKIRLIGVRVEKLQR